VSRLRRLKPFDWFMAINGTALIVSTASTYFTAELEFGLYALVILVAGAIGWRWLRRFDFPLWVLALLEIGIVAHFAGGYVKYGPEGWLYWHHFLGIRYDKIVHFYNSMVAALAIAIMFRQSRVELGRMAPLVVVGLVLGLGAAIEIVEYFAVLTIENVGVGDYANNMEDLVMNLLGGITGVLVSARRTRPEAS
jgi:hypothetical protein